MAQVRVGTASWTDRTLIESGWYPPEASTPEKRLRYYAHQFDLVEVDATYYALPSRHAAEAWAARTPAGFTFNVKAFSLFTQHPTQVAALPADLRQAAEKAGKDRCIPLGPWWPRQRRPEVGVEQVALIGSAGLARLEGRSCRGARCRR
jgi:uncharacterized protein YecE (DUF72 family)